MSEAVVYRAYAPDGELLYIGSADGDGSARIKTHQRPSATGSAWCTPDVRFEIEPHETRDAAYDAEFEAIERERPKHNRMPGRSPRPAEPVSTLTDADRAAIAAAVEALDVESWAPLTDAEADFVRRALAPADGDRAAA